MSIPKQKLFLGLAVAGALVFPATHAFAASVFTGEQASEGHKSYNTQCAMCHGEALLGPNAPALVGREVMQNFGTAHGLFNYIVAAMPPQAPGALDEEVYVDILAYILEANGAVAGDVELTANEGELRAINLAAVTSEAPAATSDDGAAAEPAASEVPQAYTWGKTLPSIEPEEQEDSGVPQAYTWGTTLPGTD